MATLSTELRKALEKTVVRARDMAEVAVETAVQALGVGLPKPPPHVDEDGRKLRNRLRAHGRQLGDAVQPDGGQAIGKLVQEAAYEHWHRMLFARFLAENGLLIHPELGVGVTLAECEELAQEEGCDAWELAGRYASRMLPQIFRPLDPVLQMNLAPEHQQALEKLLAGLPVEVLQAEDSLGWVYQFWQIKQKDEVNASEVKIGAEELSAVTQLFTEDYMVFFLLHNSLGAWWAGKTLKRGNGQERTEDAWRNACEVNGYRFDYLRFQPDGMPAAGIFEGWPREAKDITLLDPCMGSGHFLVFALPILVAFRMVEEGLTEAKAIDAVLRDNLHGLEIDPRCTQLAAFNLALAAWKRTGFSPLPPLNLACCGLKPQGSRTEWLALADCDERLRGALDQLYTLFQQAPLLGSLLNPITLAKGNLLTAGLDEVMPLLQRALKGGEDEEFWAEAESIVTAQGLATAARILGRSYNLVLTNVPYLSRGKQVDSLQIFCEANHPTAKNDLANVFLERCLDLACTDGAGVTQIVMPQNWFTLGTYQQQRKNLLKEYCWISIARLGFAAFQNMDWWAFNTILLTLRTGRPQKDASIITIDASPGRDIGTKSDSLIRSDLVISTHYQQLQNPDTRITLRAIDSQHGLNQYADCLVGIQLGDYERYGFYFWEVSPHTSDWILQHTTVRSTDLNGGCSGLLRWEKANGSLARNPSARIQGTSAWGSRGVLVRLMGSLPVSRYLGVAYDNNVAALIPKRQEWLTALWSYCESTEFRDNIRLLEEKLNVTNATIGKIPFDVAHWQQVAFEKYPQGLLKPTSGDPTQWIFHGLPSKAIDPLHVSIARLLGYTWPSESDSSMELSDESRSWIARCADLRPLVKDDGIVPIPAMRGEQPAADRLRQILATTYGSEWSPAKEQELLQSVGCGGKNLEAWLRDGFFEQHCKLFYQRPFIWHLWDGLRDGFSVLVNYHKFDRKGMESLTYSYLGDWINRQKDAVAHNESGAQGKLEKALELQKKLVAILEGEAPYDIFVRWKPLEQQSIGWEPDLNDGVRLNIRPFVTAGVLRKDPKINWNKDRGKDVESAPWFKVFNGDRINDHHLSLEEKRKAREES